MATIYEVSELAGVSLATVSRVINDTAKVSDKTKQKVLAAMAELGYRPNASAQSLASNRTNSVGLLVPELHGPFFGEMMSGIEKTLRQHKKHTIITSGHSDAALEREGIEFLIARNCDALILHVDALSDAYLAELAQSIPIVVMNRFVPALAEQCISLDNQLGGYLATTHLIAQGHREFGYIAGPAFKQDAQQRYQGHMQALAEAGLSQRPELYFQGNYQQDGGLTGLQHLLSQAQPFTALVCANDEMASGAMSYARSQGLALPESLSIIGFDDVIYAPYLFPTLSTVHYPIDEMGVMAAHWVLKQVYQAKLGAVNTLFQPHLVLRQSVVTKT